MSSASAPAMDRGCAVGAASALLSTARVIGATVRRSAAWTRGRVVTAAGPRRTCSCAWPIVAATSARAVAATIAAGVQHLLAAVAAEVEPLLATASVACTLAMIDAWLPVIRRYHQFPGG